MPTFDVTIFNISGEEPGGTDASFTIAGAQGNAQAGTATAQQPTNSETVNITGAEATGNAGTVYTGVGLSLDYPRLAIELIGSRYYMQNNTVGQELRDALGKMDYINAGIHYPGPWDSGDPLYITRDEFYAEIHAQNPDCAINDYSDVMETNRTGANADVMYENTGPAGAQNYWVTHLGERTPPPTGTAVNDWWSRKGDGEQVSSFGDTGDIVNRNITDYVTANGAGDRVPQVYGARFIEQHFANITPPKDITGVGLYVDVCAYRPKRDTIDFNGDGENDNARANWNAVGTQGYTSCVKWREGQAAFINLVKTEYPNILVTVNGTTHSREYSGTDMSVLPYIYPEYDGIMNGAHYEGVTRENFPFSGIYPDGSDLQPQYGSFQLAYNGYVQLMLSTEEPHIVWTGSSLDISPTAAINPGAGTPFHAARWVLALTLMDNGYCSITDEGRHYGSCPLFDEYGVINQSTTGLSKGWLGQPIEPVQRAPRYGVLWWREFEYGIAILNSNNRGSLSPVTVPVLPAEDALGFITAGMFKRFMGFQDSSHNNGQVVQQPFTLASKDAILLQRL